MDSHLLLLLSDMSFPFLQGLLARVSGLWLIDLLEHHKIDPMLSVYQFILKQLYCVYFGGFECMMVETRSFEGVQAGRPWTLGVDSIG